MSVESIDWEDTESGPRDAVEIAKNNEGSQSSSHLSPIEAAIAVARTCIDKRNTAMGRWMRGWGRKSQDQELAATIVCAVAPILLWADREHVTAEVRARCAVA